jgi:hypothetical protein
MTLVLFLFVFFDGGGLPVVVLVLDIAATFEISRI